MGILTSDADISLLLECLSANDNDFLELYEKAARITSQNFGSSRALFNPIYVSDICLADCPYCGYRISNKQAKRHTLKPREVVREAAFLNKRGIDNILVLAGDYKHSKYVKMLSESISAIKKNSLVSWLGIEVATLEIDEYETLRKAGAQSVTVFQETYNRVRYDELHKVPAFKGDYDFRYHAQERAIKAGFEEVGFGVLGGIGFWKEDMTAMASHALELKRKYPNINLRFSFPRLQLSEGQSEDCRTEFVSEEQLLRAIVGMRLLFPKSSLVLTGRETVDFLCKHSSIVDTLGYSGATNVGGYAGNAKGVSQFSLDRQSSFIDFTNQLVKNGFSINT